MGLRQLLPRFGVVVEQEEVQQLMALEVLVGVLEDILQRLLL